MDRTPSSVPEAESDSESVPDPGPAFFAEMVESVGVGVGIYGSDGRYIYVNRAYADLFDVEPDALVGIALWDIVPSIDADRFDRYWVSFETGETRRAETVHKVAGTAVPVETVTTQRTIDGAPYHFGTITDITERKAQEREIQRQNERLDAFASVVSHDLRNPLNVAQGYLDLLKEDVDQKEITLVENALERMDSLITELLTLAQSGETIGDTEPTPIAATADAAWSVVSAPSASLRIADRTGTIEADPSRLQQLFSNLFRNAIEHGGEDVTVDVGPIEDGFYVEDDGVGIDQTDCDAVFEAGYTTAADGTGFGLSIVKQVVDGHGWDVRIAESEHGGARFEITDVTFLE